jgi:hypothetical protein
MDVIALLKAANRSDMETPPVNVEIKRLSKVFGEPFVLQLKPICYEDWEMACSKKTAEYRVLLIAKAWVDAKKLDSDTLDRFGASSADELLKKILQPGEIAQLAARVEKISGFGDSIAELKKK